MDKSLFIPKGKPSEWHTLDQVNWPDAFPYKPDVKFRLWHDGASLHLDYEVEEQGTRALQSVLGDPVYEDSCVECFIQPRPETDPRYYNFEFNPIGMLAMACRTGRNDPENAPLAVLESVSIKASAGSEPFAEKPLGKWSLNICIPVTAFFNSGVECLDGMKMKMNLFKCGDALKVPHFVTWAPISTPGPDYHRSEFFIPVEFEK